MVRLKCDKCKHMWKESSQQEKADNVYCPKCGEFNHMHSKPINPPKPMIVKEKEEPTPAPFRRVLNPPKRIRAHQRTMDGRNAGKVNLYKTEKVDKDGAED